VLELVVRLDPPAGATILIVGATPEVEDVTVRTEALEIRDLEPLELTAIAVIS
jgi:hypothetical protein